MNTQILCFYLFTILQIRYNPVSTTLSNRIMKTTFEEEFRARLDDIIKRGAAVGLTVTQLCSNAGVARATPDRWRKRAPKTIKLIDQFEAEVARAEERKVKRK